MQLSQAKCAKCLADFSTLNHWEIHSRGHSGGWTLQCLRGFLLLIALKPKYCPYFTSQNFTSVLNFPLTHSHYFQIEIVVLLSKTNQLNSLLKTPMITEVSSFTPGRTPSALWQWVHLTFCHRQFSGRCQAPSPGLLLSMRALPTPWCLPLTEAGPEARRHIIHTQVCILVCI